MFGDLTSKMKTNPVMNQVFQDPQTPWVKYKSYSGVRPNAAGLAAGAAIDPHDLKHWEADHTGLTSHDEEKAKANPGIYGPNLVEHGARTTQFLLLRPYTQYTKFDNGNLYWENMQPSELYDLKLVNPKENPLLNVVRGSKIKITNTFQSFSK